MRRRRLNIILKGTKPSKLIRGLFNIEFDKPINAIALTLLIAFWLVIGGINLVYPRIELFLYGENITAQIIKPLPNDASTTDKGQSSSSHAHRHIVEVEGKEYEVFLQASYAPQKVFMRWIPANHEAVLISSDGKYNLVDLLGGWADTYYFIAYFLMLFYWPILVYSSFKCCFRNRK